MQKITGILNISGSGTEQDPHYASFIPFQVDLSQYAFDLIGEGAVRITSPDFVSTTSVLMQSDPGGGNGMAKHLCSGTEVTGFCRERYSFEDDLGAIDFIFCDLQGNVSNDVAKAYVVDISFKQNS